MVEIPTDETPNPEADLPEAGDQPLTSDANTDIDQDVLDPSPAQPARHEESPRHYTYIETQRPRARKQGRGIGCWLVGLFTGFVVTGMVIAGLFLPPVRLGERLFGKSYAILSPQGNAVPAENFIFSVHPDNVGVEFGVVIETLSPADLLAGDDKTKDWFTSARAALPSYLIPESLIYTIDTIGTPPDEVMMTIILPQNVTAPYMLDMYAWNEGNKAWQFLPSRHIVDENGTRIQFARTRNVPQHVGLFRATSADPVILSVLEIGQNIPQQAIDVLTIVSPTGMQPSLPTTPQRTLIGNPAAGFDLNAPYKVMPVIRNFADPRATDPETVTAIIGNRELRDEHIQQLTAFAGAGGYKGLFIDYRDLPADQRSAFTGFIRELSASLRQYNLTLGVVVPQPAIAPDDTWDTGAYDWRALGESVDHLQVNFEINPTSYAEGGFIEALIQWTVGEISRYKVLGRLSALSVREAAGGFTSIGYTEALAPLGNVQVVFDGEKTKPGDIVPPGESFNVRLDGSEALAGTDTTLRTPFLNYLAEDGTAAATMWLTTPEALLFRLERLAPFGIGGIAFPDLLHAGTANGLFEVLLNYRIQLPSTLSQTELALNWRIENAAGQVAAFNSGFNEEIVVTIDAQAGNYAVNVDVVGGSISSARSGAAVALFQPTPTPTPLPTNTPLPTPTPTPTLAPIIPTAVPQPGAGTSGGTAPQSQAAPVFPAGGSIATGAFEYGGHITSTGNAAAINAMRTAGMTWVKVQIRYGRGNTTGDAATAIAQAHGAGLKILLGVVGVPSQLEQDRNAYTQDFIRFIGEVAALGPDAIEVWNEPNIDREWPTGQISGENYTAILRDSYNAIKSRNPNVMVISAAPSPTGAEAAFPGRVVNDDNFIRQMVAAGALQYMDCLGMHYNEGIVSPRATSGDPRDNYFTRYLPTMIDMYWNISGGQRPICITELGYLTSHGYGGLSAYWSWASNVTIQQHAAWLADAAAYSSQTGRVRLMIVWNVDFTHYDGNDPMAGYAMIRADGSCPACQAFAAAR